MNPQSNEQMGINLPPPVAEQQPVTQPTEQAPQQFEQAGRSPEVARPGIPLPTAMQPVAAAHIASTPLPTAPLNSAMPTASSVVPTTADDGDLIEKEWVAKAKQIVDKTREDPYEQTKELTLVKADYMKQRYNKTLKLGE